MSAPAQPEAWDHVPSLESLVRRIAREEAKKVVGEKRLIELEASPPNEGNSQNPTDEPFLTVAQAAKLASVCEPTVRSWVNTGRLTRYRAGRHLRVKRSDILSFLGSDHLPRSADDLGSKATKILSEL